MFKKELITFSVYLKKKIKMKYICKSKHRRTYWIRKERYSIEFHYGEIYDIIFEKGTAVVLDVNSAILAPDTVQIPYTEDSFNHKFKK